MARHEQYMTAFLHQVLQLKPHSVLDVGCGDGSFIGVLNASGVTASGIDPDPTHQCDKIMIGKAENLPLASNSFDIVVSTYALHHYLDPTAFFSEAARVARHHVLVLDQWYDQSIPSQRAAQSVCRWKKTIEQRNGIIHNYDFGADDILKILASLNLSRDAFLTTSFFNEQLSIDELNADLSDFINKTQLCQSDADSLVRIRAEIEITGVICDGAIMVMTKAHNQEGLSK